MHKENTSSRTYDVLVVEDNKDDVELFLRALQKVQGDLEMEIKPHALSDGALAAARIKKQKFDAIFLDVNLPPPDGMELARQIRASLINRTTPIIMISGADERGLMGRAFQAGVNFFLFKPVDRARLMRLIQIARVPIDRERRRLQRVKVQCKVTIESGQDRFVGETLDLSLNGMFVHSPRVLLVGSIVQVTLSLPRVANPIRTTARVVRAVGSEFMGIQLENSGTAETEKLEEFLLPLILDALEAKLVS